MPSVNLGFSGEDQDGIYHSVYDDFYFYTHFLDTDFVYERALAQTIGTAVIRLADSDVVPFEYNAVADTAGTYVKELKDLLKERQDEAREYNRELADGVLSATFDPRRPTHPAAAKPVPPALDFAPLDNALTALTESASRYEDALRAKAPVGTAAVAAVNAKLLQAERQFLDPAGLSHREWFRHLLYAPGFYTGYGVKTMPGPREAIEQGEFTQADAEIGRVAKALAREAAWLDSATALMK